MKKLSLGKLKLLSEEVLERSHMATVIGGEYTFYNCVCGSGEPFTLMSDGNPLADAGCYVTEDVSCVVAP
ncbi:TIGR04149 family rSAM-modified RiPP [Algoriphagus antarcticus]|uniref:Natural product n=1 Tax=Algoriphagus antarcticus TaxID=238540 RepID=A0A3E0DNW9_9BACT|nr:TIGR04149 family rSAM-modified RiPP [Algoriphagus antarcticus]REG84547.1 natural product precursor [Algoriphagus antarcticus]